MNTKNTSVHPSAAGNCDDVDTENTCAFQTNAPPDNSLRITTPTHQRGEQTNKQYGNTSMKKEHSEHCSFEQEKGEHNSVKKFIHNKYSRNN